MIYHDDLTPKLFYTCTMEDIEDLDISSLQYQEVLSDEASDCHVLIVTARLPVANFDAEDDELEDAAIVAFRGTASFQNVRSDIDFRLAPLEAPSLASLAASHRIETARVHAGFQAALLNLKDR